MEPFRHHFKVHIQTKQQNIKDMKNRLRRMQLCQVDLYIYSTLFSDFPIGSEKLGKETTYDSPARMTTPLFNVNVYV